MAKVDTYTIEGKEYTEEELKDQWSILEKERVAKEAEARNSMFVNMPPALREAVLKQLLDILCKHTIDKMVDYSESASRLQRQIGSHIWRTYEDSRSLKFGDNPIQAYGQLFEQLYKVHVDKAIEETILTKEKTDDNGNN